jgi:hypothetical protein
MSYDSRPDTWDHIDKVRGYLKVVISKLQQRADDHDQSKLSSPEVEIFDEFTPKLADVEYGSEEYESFRVSMDAALEHHYAANSHHPEHYSRGIEGMSLLDLLEMIVDWKAASERHNRPPAPASPGRANAPEYDSSIVRSVRINQERFGYSDELKAILLNTVREMGWT